MSLKCNSRVRLNICILTIVLYWNGPSQCKHIIYILWVFLQKKKFLRKLLKRGLINCFLKIILIDNSYFYLYEGYISRPLNYVNFYSSSSLHLLEVYFDQSIGEKFCIWSKKLVCIPNMQIFLLRLYKIYIYNNSYKFSWKIRFLDNTICTIDYLECGCSKLSSF